MILEMRLTPIGVVRSPIRKPMAMAGAMEMEPEERIAMARAHNAEVNNTVCDLVIDAEYAELLEGIEEFSHILVLYWPHLLEPDGRRLRQVHPMGRKDLPRKGIFATCSPARPNPVLVTAVPLLERAGNVLKVRGLEAVDGSPLIDIKPYAAPYYGVRNPAVPEWMRRIHRELGIEEIFSPPADADR